MTGDEHPGLMASDMPVELRVCPQLRRATEGPAVRKVRTPAGDEAWLVSGHTEVRDLLRDHRLGRSHATPRRRAQYAGDPTYDQVMHANHEQADAMHAGLRSLIKPVFTTRRMLAIRPVVEAFVDRRVDLLLAEGPPADLRTDFSEPLVRRVLCFLIGVPDADAPDFDLLMRRSAHGDLAGLTNYLSRLVTVKRSYPDDTVVSRLCRSGASDQQVVQVIILMQFAGLGATSKQISYGVLLLTEQPDKRAAVTADRALLRSAVEEMLRLSGSVSLPRYARQDIEVGGVTISAGDLVLLDLTLANYDGTAFDDPTTLDLARSPNRHMTFGHGAWTCLGAPLAIMLLETVFDAMLTRLPDLRPTAPVDRRRGPLSGGLPDRVDVVW